MPPWLFSIVIPVTVGLIMFLVNKLTFKSSAEVEKEIKSLKDAVEQLKREGWSTEQRVNLEARLTTFSERISRLDEEVDFTRSSHQEFLRLLEKALIPVAHSPHTPELDRLLDKRDRGEDLSADEWKELLKRLDEQARFYGEDSPKRIALRGLRAIYLAQMRAARRREGALSH